MADINLQFNDKDEHAYIKDIAYSKAMCEYNINYALCNKDCAHCEYGYINNVSIGSYYDNLPYHIKAAIVKSKDDYYAKFITLRYNMNRNRKLDRAILIVIILVCILIALCTGALFYNNINKAAVSTTEAGVYEDTDIVYVLKKTKENVHDITGDNIVNCKDYAIMYKQIWDKYYNPKDCRVMYTVMYFKPTGRNQPHLYVAVYKNGYWVAIEPQGTVDTYDLYVFWGIKLWYVYRVYNEYVGETEWKKLIK